ncbi:high affinity branched-chain amino acid ABC transporter, ATP-binding protein, partial [mine drainage metagenome]
MSDPILVISDLAKSFGGFVALDGVSLELGEGEVVGLVGPNGSGKTTLINVVSGLYAPSRGTVVLGGRPLHGGPPHRVVRSGMNRTFQIPKPLGTLTVSENLRVAAGWGAGHRALEGDPLKLVGLGGLERRFANSLNASQQKRLDLARALATSPRVLLVDELGAGLSPAELDDAAGVLRRLASAGIALLVVEHLMGFLAKVTSRVMVLNAGRQIFQGSLEEAVQDPQVVEVFLG